MKFTVYHRAAVRFTELSADALAAFPVGFTKVAVVETDDVNRVFQLTNSIDCAWWTNPEVSEAIPGRSTSVGDVIEDEHGGRYAVQNFGLRVF